MIFDTDFTGLTRGAGTIFIKTVLLKMAYLKIEK